MDINLEEFLKIPSHYENEKPRDTSTRMPLTAKRAMELLLEGKLGKKVCKFCLHTDSHMYEMGQIFEIAGKKASCRVTVRDMIGSFYPFKITNNSELPTLMCNKCLNRTINSYLFAQQCDRSERAFQNFIEDMDDKFDKLDPLERPKKRGRQKLYPNTSVLYSAHELVYDYADPQMCLVNRGNDLKKSQINPLECPKCWRQFSSVELRMNHEVLHPQSMWFCCRICGLSFPKHNPYKRHLKECHEVPIVTKNPVMACKCKCGNVTENYSEHLQHIEKHKFKTIMKSVMDGKMDKLCVVCLGKGKSMVDLNMSLRMHGGYPEITGDRSLHNILNTTLPNQNQLMKPRKYPILNIAKMFKTKLDYVKNKSMTEEVTEDSDDNAKDTIPVINAMIFENEDKTNKECSNKEIGKDCIKEDHEIYTPVQSKVTEEEEDEDSPDRKRIKISDDHIIDSYTFTTPFTYKIIQANKDKIDKKGYKFTGDIICNYKFSTPTMHKIMKEIEDITEESIKVSDNANEIPVAVNSVAEFNMSDQTEEIQETTHYTKKINECDSQIQLTVGENEEIINIETPAQIISVSQSGLEPRDDTSVCTLDENIFTLKDLTSANENKKISELDKIEFENSTSVDKNTVKDNLDDKVPPEICVNSLLFNSELSGLDKKEHHSDDINTVKDKIPVQLSNNELPELEKQEHHSENALYSESAPKENLYHKIPADICLESLLYNKFEKLKQDADTQTDIAGNYESQKPMDNQAVQTDNIIVANNSLEKGIQVNIQKTIEVSTVVEVNQPMDIDELAESTQPLTEAQMDVNYNNEPLNTYQSFNISNLQPHYFDFNTSKVEMTPERPVTQMTPNTKQFTIGTAEPKRVTNVDSARRILRPKRRH